MLRANLHTRAKFIAGMAVIDRDDVTTPQVRRHIFNPIERSLIERNVITSGSLDKNKFVTVEIDKLFPAVADQTHRHGIEKFVREMNADERLNRIAPFHFIAKQLECLQLSILQDGERLDDSIAQSGKKIRAAFARRLKDITRKVAMMSPLFDNDKVIDLVEPFPYLRELRGQQLSKKRPDAHVCEVISTPPNRASARGIISVLGMIEGLLHEPGKRHRTAVLNFRADNFEQSGVPGGHL